MFDWPVAATLIAALVSVPVTVAAVYRRRGGEPGEGATESSAVSLKEVEGRLRSLEIANEGFRAEVRGEFKLLKEMIQVLPSGQQRRGGIGFGDEEYSRGQ